MHGRIYEFSLERMPQDDWCTEFSFYDNDISDFADWIGSSPSDRGYDLDDLKRILPSSMFKMEGDEIEIISNGEELIENWLYELKEQVNNLDCQNWAKEIWHIQRKIKNMLDADIMFRNYYGNILNPTEFIEYCIRYYKGTKLYIGGIVDYHY